MNNNRNNNNNRRRGRGNRPQGQGGNPVNRIDSRARGNAPQMLEKYKKLAQDAQHNGDRVQAEYYLQFADHYYRVLADSRPRHEERPRQEDGRPRRDDRAEQRAQAGDEFYGDDDDAESRDDVQEPRFQEGRAPEQRGQERAPEQRRHDRVRDNREGAQDGARDNRRGRLDDGNGQGRNPQPRYASESGEGVDAEPSQLDNDRDERPARRERLPRNSSPRAPRVARAPVREDEDAAPVIDASVLPPAFKVDADEGAMDESVRAAPRRRRVKPAIQDDDAAISAVG